MRVANVITETSPVKTCPFRGECVPDCMMRLEYTKDSGIDGWPSKLTGEFVCSIAEMGRNSWR